MKVIIPENSDPSLVKKELAILSIIPVSAPKRFLNHIREEIEGHLQWDNKVRIREEERDKKLMVETKERKLF